MDKRELLKALQEENKQENTPQERSPDPLSSQTPSTEAESAPSSEPSVMPEQLQSRMDELENEQIESSAEKDLLQARVSELEHDKTIQEARIDEILRAVENNNQQQDEILKRVEATDKKQDELREDTQSAITLIAQKVAKKDAEQNRKTLPPAAEQTARNVTPRPKPPSLQTPQPPQKAPAPQKPAEPTEPHDPSREIVVAYPSRYGNYLIYARRGCPLSQRRPKTFQEEVYYFLTGDIILGEEGSYMRSQEEVEETNDSSRWMSIAFGVGMTFTVMIAYYVLTMLLP